MKEGKKKNNIIDRAKSNMEKNRKEQKVEKFFGVLLKYLNTLDVNMFIVNKKHDIFDIYVLINTSGPYNPDSERNSIIEVINRLRSKQNHFMSIVVNDERDDKLSYDYYKNNLYNDGKKCYISYQLLISYYIMINYYFKTYKRINEKEK